MKLTQGKEIIQQETEYKQISVPHCQNWKVINLLSYTGTETSSSYFSVVNTVNLHPLGNLNSVSIIPMTNTGGHLISALNPSHLGDGAGSYFVTGNNLNYSKPITCLFMLRIFKTFQ